MPAKRISLAGPGKRDNELAQAIKTGIVINAESTGEIERTANICDEIGQVANVAIRVNPDIELRSAGMKMSGRASPFGIDQNVAADAIRNVKQRNQNFVGLHFYCGSQCLDSGAIILLLVSGKHNADLDFIAQKHELRLGRCDDRRVRNETGFAIGGVAPIGHLIDVPIYMDQALLFHDRVDGHRSAP